jgi:hypothetical protein
MVDNPLNARSPESVHLDNDTVSVPYDIAADAKIANVIVRPLGPIESVRIRIQKRDEANPAVRDGSRQLRRAGGYRWGSIARASYVVELGGFTVSDKKAPK